MLLKKNNLSWRNALVASVCITLAIFASCSEDESNDTDLPTVSITGLPEDGVVWDTVDLQVEAADNEAIRSVVITLDGTTIVEKTESSFSAELNTLILAEGEHTLLVTATDESGNEKSETYIFTVRNILITIDAPDDLLGDGDKRGFVFLSDANGDTIIAREYGNGDHVILRAPECNERGFFLTEVYLDKHYNTVELRTFKVMRGTTWKSTPGHIDETVGTAGPAWLSFVNPIPGALYTARSDRDVVLFSNKLLDTPLDLIGGQARLYITRGNDYSHPTHYVLTDPVSIGSQNSPIDLGQVNNEMVIKDVDLSAYAYGETYVEVTGIMSSAQRSTYYGVYSEIAQKNHIQYRYPGATFADYLCRTVYRYDDYWGVNIVHGMPDFTPLHGSINDIHVTEARITGAIPGNDIDYVDLYLLNGNTYWHFYTENGAIDQVIPVLPKIVQEQFTFQASDYWIQIGAMQRPDFEGYSGFLNFIRTSAIHGAIDLDRYGESYKKLGQEIFLSSEGRRRAHDIREMR